MTLRSGSYSINGKGFYMADELAQCKHNNVAPMKVINSLPESQGNPGRHQCTICAYSEGYTAGLAAARQSASTIFGSTSAASSISPNMK